MPSIPMIVDAQAQQVTCQNISCHALIQPEVARPQYGTTYQRVPVTVLIRSHPLRFISSTIYRAPALLEVPIMSHKRLLIRKAAALGAALGMAILLAGCVIVPVGPYYHPHHYWGY